MEKYIFYILYDFRSTLSANFCEFLATSIKIFIGRGVSIYSLASYPIIKNLKINGNILFQVYRLQIKPALSILNTSARYCLWNFEEEKISIFKIKIFCFWKKEIRIFYSISWTQ